MATSRRSTPEEEVDQLLLNARLRDEIEPYLDESVQLVDAHTMPTQTENEFLASMLAWERAPVLPISHWFRPRLKLPPPETLDDNELHQRLWDAIHKLYSKRIVLDFTDHLSDRELYCLVYRDILPSLEKKIERDRTFLHWHCVDPSLEPDVWLRYYASEEERQSWLAETRQPLPESESPPFPRRMPRRM